MRILVALAAACLLAAALPTAAQVPFSGMELTIGSVAGTIQEDNKDRVPYRGSATIPVTVKLGCVEIFQALPEPAVEVTMDQPTWMSVTPALLAFPPEQCIDPSGFAQATGNVAFTLKAEAPGVVPQTLNVTATFDTLTDAEPVTFAVAYHSEYTVVPDVTFPVQVRGNEAVFNITVTQKSNARSMVMFEEVKADRGTISGLASVPYDNPPASKTFKVTYKGPQAAWTDAKVDFVTKGHYLLTDSTSGPLIDHKPTTWTFTNAEPGQPGPTSDSPLNGWVLLVALLGAALVAARRA